jgi:hypothetical protein
MQQSMTEYEQKILNDMKGLTEREQANSARIFHLIKQEVIPESDEKRITDEFLTACGTWEDNRSIEK